jgi:ADP-ribose pyrophosphatase YjhB (NUDIX family)
MISADLYKKIMDSVPLVTVDLVIVSRGKVLLVKRDLPPLLNEFWTPGGALKKGETILKACLRKAHEETGLICSFSRPLGIFDAVFKTSAFGVSQHNISIICELFSLSNAVKLDGNHSEFKWIPKSRVEELYESLCHSSDIERFKVFRFDTRQHINSR